MINDDCSTKKSLRSQNEDHVLWLREIIVYISVELINWLIMLKKIT